MQNYTEISEDKTLKDSRALLLDNDKTAMSNNSGTEFPTTNLQPGMLCFRTDLKKFYYLAADGTTWVEIIDVSEDNGWVQRANVADNAEKVNDHTVNADVPVNAKFTDTTYEVATDSQAGLMTAAQKTKLDNLENFSLPVASADTLGGVKIGDGLSISETGLLEVGSSGIPIGTVIMFTGSSSPVGWLLCDGSEVSRENYAALFSVIGTIYGTGNGSSTFNLPLLTDNRFIEGSTTPGTQYAAGLPNITGATYTCTGDGSGAFYYNRTSRSAYGYTSGNAAPSAYGVSFAASRSNSIYGASATVQPKATTLIPIIKYI